LAVLCRFRHRHVTRPALAWSAWLIDLVLPRRCVGCGASADLICPSCFRALRPLGPPRCACCGSPAAWPVARCRECSGRRLAFATARAAVAYEGPARALVGAWKERGLRPVASLAAELVAAHVERPAADVITYIPPDPVRQLERGDHPAGRLAAKLAARWGIDPASLMRRRMTVGRQTALRLDERRRNVRGAFAADPLGPVRVVLVDDVYTTGATVDAAATALRAAGAARVEVVTFARAVR
jgi:predicted amidophosphoribosyltransferase